MSESSDLTLDLAFETLYRFMAAGLKDPRHDLAELLFDDATRRLAVAATEILRTHFEGQPVRLGFGELPLARLDLQPALDVLGNDRQRLTEEYQRVFGLVTCRECPPYETEYCPNQDPFYRSQQMADIAGFYRAFGIEPAAERRERPDHLALELEFVAMLLARKRWATEQFQSPEAADGMDICEEARTKFQRDHLHWWVPSFSLALRNQAEQGFYADLGQALAALLPLDRHRLNLAPPSSPLRPLAADTADSCEGCDVSSCGVVG